jgi:L-cysteine desulfidase
VVGAVVASAAGIAYLQKLPLASINKLINFLLCSFGGILCDGAKPSCSNKIFSAYASAFTILRLEHYNIDSIGGQGIINEDCFKTIESLGRISQKSKDVLVDEIIKNIEVK